MISNCYNDNRMEPREQEKVELADPTDTPVPALK